MTLPVVEQIAETIATRVQSCTTINGYSTQLSAFYRPTRINSTMKPIDKSALLTQGDPELDEETSTEGNPRVVAWKLPFHITLFVVPSDTDETPVDTQINQFTSDVIKALTAPDNWQQFADGATSPDDHLAINSWISGMAHIPDADGKFDGMIIEYTVHYRTPETDPYAVG